MRRLLEPCWWILFLKITSSVLHYVVCFPGECRPPRGRAALASARGGCGVVAGARSSDAGPRDPGEGGGGRTPGREEGSALLVLAAVREALGWEGWKEGLTGEGDRGLRGSVVARVWWVWGTRSREKRGLALPVRRRLGELDFWGGWGYCDQGRMPLWV